MQGMNPLRHALKDFVSSMPGSSRAPTDRFSGMNKTHTVYSNSPNVDASPLDASHDQQKFQPPTKPQLHHEIKFVFVMGLEGTGHHYLHSILQQSPLRFQLQQWKLLRPLTTLSLSLWNDANHMGLFNAWCRSHHKYHYSKHQENEVVNITRIVHNVAHQMQRLEKQIQGALEGDTRSGTHYINHTRTNFQSFAPFKSIGFDHFALSDTGSNVLYIPVNVLTYTAKSGMMSYPNYFPPCRGSPDLHLWYQACALASVQCQHLYLFRSLTDIVESSLQRNLTQDIATAMTLEYHAALSQIVVQLTQFPYQTKACLGLFEPDSNSTAIHLQESDRPNHEQDQSTVSSTRVWRNETMGILRNLFGWNWPSVQGDTQKSNNHDFEAYMRSLYHPPSPKNATRLIQVHHLPWWNSLQSLQHQALALCRQNANRLRQE
ncbi:hypothetical protein ACA910_022335 [Epithemia clementina (nom. ined.)]